MRPALGRVCGENIGHEHFSGITRAGVAASLLQEIGERDLSLFAVCRASRALAAAASLGPCDVIAAALFEEA